ncbi:hypothetical protein QAD02_012593 [Eretmocerus hayati]|uniref:Uncharacterized protein n=1 Tax=Eretmocerus hayati TaxID=131215 RepID=A0ACC2P053_9HYME|nr:hypothetical protein QAD02_012593 [Eretmocerus hayati]
MVLFQGAVLLKEFGPIDYIDFAPVEPYNFAVTCSCRVQIYDSNTRTVQKNFNKFSKSVYGASYRYDGRLLCVGGEEAVIKVFDVDSKSLLRQFSDHKAAVHRAYFTSDGTHLVSFSDDKTTALWDIPAEKKVVSFSDHIDYVRAGSVSPISPSIFSSGGYDGTINMYDSRTSKNILRLSHESPVQSLCFLPHGGVLISAG